MLPWGWHRSPGCHPGSNPAPRGWEAPTCTQLAPARGGWGWHLLLGQLGLAQTTGTALHGHRDDGTAVLRDTRGATGTAHSTGGAVGPGSPFSSPPSPGAGLAAAAPGPSRADGVGPSLLTVR